MTWPTEQAREAVRAAVGRETADYGPEVARAVLAALAPHVAALVRAERAAALREAADEMAAVIADGDCAEVAARVARPVRVARASVVARRDALYEEPDAWLRERADRIEREGQQ